VDCTTQANQSGSNTVTVRLSDSGALYTEPTFTITVDAINDQPWIEGLSNPANLTYNSGLNQDVISSTDIDNNFRDVEEDQNPTSVAILSQTNPAIVNCELGGHALDCTTQTNQAGTSTVIINYTDSGGLYVTDSIDISITPDTTLPTPSFGTNPVNTYNDSDGSIIFELKCFDNDGLDTLQLWGNWTGTWHANQTNSTPINNTIWSIQVDDIPEGRGHVWGVWCNDSAGNSNWSDTNRTFMVDFNPPILSEEHANETDILQNEIFCLNVTATDALNGIHTIYAEVWDTTSWANYSMVDDGSTTCDSDLGDDVYGVEIIGNTVGLWNYSRVYANDSTGNMNSYGFSANITINVTSAPDNPPEIVAIYNITSNIIDGPNEGPSPTYILINFTAYDQEGFGNLDSSSANVTVTTDYTTNRTNASCIEWATWDTNYANYTCNITMWWWDDPGNWTIHASISDAEENMGTNSSLNFTVGTTTGFLANSSELSWPDIDPGAIDQEANEFLLLNNTGNIQVSVEVNATNLTGESDPAYALGANNFSVNTIAGCEGTPMVASLYTTISGASILKGNYTDGVSALEEIYFCLEQSNSDLFAQFYSTDINGAWTIRVFLVAVIPAGRRKKKQKKKKKEKAMENDNLLKALNLIADELKEEYSLNKKEVIEIIIKKLKTKYNISRKEFLEIIKAREGISIPITIFTKELGGLETVSKYMKENLNMSYKNTAKELGRDNRTIWTAYKKATEKQKTPIKIKETKIQIPISIFENKELTILESLVIYLKDKKIMKYSEIAKFLERDQRNNKKIY